MFWPAYYALILLIVFLVVRHVPARAATGILAVAVILQIADSSAGWREIRAGFHAEPASVWAISLQHEFWGEAAQRYSAIRAIPPQKPHPEWRDISYFAATNGLSTDAVFLSRVRQAQEDEARARMEASVGKGLYDADSIYIVEPDYVTAVEAAFDVDRDFVHGDRRFPRPRPRMVLAALGWSDSGGYVLCLASP
jgi:hypothetical protein